MLLQPLADREFRAGKALHLAQARSKKVGSCLNSLVPGNDMIPCHSNSRYYMAFLPSIARQMKYTSENPSLPLAFRLLGTK